MWPLSRLKRIEQKLDLLLELGEKNMSAFDELATQVQANTDAEAAAVQLIQGLATEILQTAGDPAKVTALTAKLKASADALGAAIVANTPAGSPAPAPVVLPDPASNPGT